MSTKPDSSAKRGSVSAHGQATARFNFKCDLLSLNCIRLIFSVLKKKIETFKDVKYLKIGRFVKKSGFLASLEGSECSQSHMVTNH